MSYTPINCNYYDKLEAYATLKTTLTIVYIEDAKTCKIHNTRIVTLFAKNHEEFLVLDNEQIIRLDKLVSINGETIPDAC